MAGEQTYLCTLQVGTPLILRTKSCDECIPQWSNNRLTLINAQGIHEATINHANVLWIRLLKCNAFKVRVVLDKRLGTQTPSLIRIYVITQNLVSQFRSLQSLLEEELLQECLQLQPQCIETIDSHLDRSLRKLMRVTNDRIKDVSENVSDQTSEVAALMMRIREANEGNPQSNTPITTTSIGNGSGIRYNWNSFVFENYTTAQVERPSTKQTLQANELSLCEISVLTAWKLACVDTLSAGPNQAWFFAPHCLMIYVNSATEASAWIAAAEKIHLTASVASIGKLPADVIRCDVLVVPLTSESAVTQVRDATVANLSQAMRLQNEALQFDTTQLNERRMRRLQMSTLTRWSEANVQDLPLAWFCPGAIVQDAREGPIQRSFTSLLEPNLELLTGSSDLSQRNMWNECKSLTTSMSLGPSKKAFKNLRVKQTVVPPDLIETKMHQVASAFDDPTSAIQKMQAAQTSLQIRGNLNAQASESQLIQILDDHHAQWPNQTIAQWIQKASGNVRRRPSVDNSESVCDICVEPIDRKVGCWTTVCGHSQCSVCGPLAFRNWTSNHHAGSTFVDCPSCRTSLSSFDTVRVKEGIEPYLPLDTISQAIDREIATLPKRTRTPNYAVLSCQDDPSATFQSETSSSIQNLILTHVSETTLYEWQVQIVLWTTLSKKNLRVTIIGSPNHAPSQALKKLLDFS